MLQRISNIENVGVFKEYSLDETKHGNVEFSKTNLIYGENSSGKSTLVGILNSLRNNDSEILEGRKSIGNYRRQNIELLMDHNTYLFNGKWNIAYPTIAIFDQEYINENIHLGNDLSINNRRNQFDIMVGKENISISLELKEINKTIRDIGKEKRAIEMDLKSKIKGSTSLDEFIKMDERVNNEHINIKLEQLIKQRENYNNRSRIIKLSLLDILKIPSFDISIFKVVLSTDNNQLLSSFEEKVKSYMDKRGTDISWIENGYEKTRDGTCPFCNQSLDTSDIFQSYKAYFNINLKQYSNRIKNMDSLIKNSFGRDNALECILLLERNQNLFNEMKHTFNIESDYQFEITEIGNKIIKLFNHISLLMSQKLKNPFNTIDYSTEIYNLNKEYKDLALIVENYNLEAAIVNQNINQYKDDSRTIDITYIESKINYYENLAISKEEEVVANIYLYNKLYSKLSEIYNRKNYLIRELSKINNLSIRAFNTKLNELLESLKASFKVNYIYPKFNNYGVEANYNIIIKNQGLKAKTTKNESIKIPNFKNTLSGGEKNLLALAYFITTIKMSSNEDNHIIVFDDPTNYSDKANKGLIAERIMDLANEDNQIIILTHDIEFSKKFWELNVYNDLTGLYVYNNDESSEIVSRDVYRSRLL